MKLNDEWMDYINSNKKTWIEVYSPFTSGLEFTLDEKLVYVKLLMEFNSKRDIMESSKEIRSKYESKFPTEERDAIHNIVTNTKRWRNICYKIQRYYEVEPHSIDPKSVLLGRIHNNLKTVIECSKFIETDERAVLLRYDLLKEIHAYSDNFKFDKSHLIYVIRNTSDIPEIKWLCTMLKLAPRLTYIYLFEVLLKFGTMLYKHYLRKDEDFSINYNEDINGYVSED